MTMEARAIQARAMRAQAMRGAIRRREWERIALALLLSLAEAARRVPPGEIEDLLQFLDGETWESGSGKRDRSQASSP